jgi:hypothetical protein
MSWDSRCFVVFYMPGFGSNKSAVSEYLSTCFKWRLNLFEHLLAKRGKGTFFARDTASYADVAVWDMLNLHVSMVPNALANHPRLSLFYTAMEALPTLATYLQQRRALDPSILANVQTE